ncbi:MAG: hypothetical protein KY437_00605 [Actinobacteria bacterium]|nr:hypothetical protein [Actinomycetota bacterium]
MANHTLRVFSVGRTEIPGPELYWMSDWDRWYELSFNVALIQGENSVVLVNTGAPEDLTPLNNRWTSALGPRGRFERDPHQAVTTRLDEVGLTPADVTDVVVTPFQLYSTAGIPLFSHARIHLSRRGWVHFHTTHEHPHDDRWTSFAPEVLVHLVTDGWDRVHLLDDEDEVTLGVRTWFAGAHHRASIAVEVDSTVGTVVLSDAFFHYGNVEGDRLLGINESMYETLATYERARRVADHLVPLYDPEVFERYPDGVVAPDQRGVVGAARESRS